MIVANAMSFERWQDGSAMISNLFDMLFDHLQVIEDLFHPHILRLLDNVDAS